MAFVSVGTDVELYYEDYGGGRPVVLIHGWPLSGRSWEWQVPVLVDAGYRVVTYDRRGFGRSSRPWTGYDFDTFAADLRALVDHVDLTDATLVGFSMGGGEVARYLSTYGSQRVSQAVFAGAVPPYIHKTAANPDGWLDDTTIAGFHAGIRGDRIAFLEALFVEYFAAAGRNDLASTAMREYHRDLAALASPKATLDCVDAFAYTDFRSDLDKVTIPTLVLHSDSDTLVPLAASGQRTHEAIPGSQLVVVPQAPHGFNVTHATQFNQALLDFLAT